jgi:uncharacterized protein YceH (UPF0502 family)
MNLSSSETRVLGCLMEKQRTTPDAYPLSLNALRLACNQSTNREPVVQYDDAVIRDALHRLERRGYTRLASGAGSRAAKYRHLLAEALPMEDDEHAVICVLMLRGPQTPGELKQRAERMHAFGDLGGVHETLERLIGRGLVAVLERRPGQKEERYTQLLGEGDSTAGDAGFGAHHQPLAPAPLSANLPYSQLAGHASRGSQSPAVDAIEALDERVARLEREVARLRAALGDQPDERGRDAGELADRPAQAGGEPAGSSAQAGGEFADRSAQAAGELADRPTQAVGELADRSAQAVGELADQPAHEQAAAEEMLEWT